MRRRGLLLVLAALFLLAAASASADNRLEGTYTTTLTRQSPSLLNGRWELRLLAGGRYTIFRNGARVVEGRGPRTRDRIGFGQETGPYACTGAAGSATYRWVLRGRLLTLTPLSETCLGRKLVLTTHPLVRQG